jgi:predicted cupin superfamily sugar epimerase
VSDLNEEEVKRLLGLEPLGFEGGYYRQQYRSGVQLSLPELYEGPRSAGTAIYYMLTPNTLSLMHRLRTDEVYHFYLGAPVEQLMLHPDGRAEHVVLGADIRSGQAVQHVVPANVWQGSRLAPGGNFALMGTTMSPGFDLEDFELGDRAQLRAAHPEHSDLLIALTSDRLLTENLELAAATRDLLHAELRGAEVLAAGLRAEVPADLPRQAPVYVQFILRRLEEAPAERGWWTWYVIDKESRKVLGVAGFEGPPDDDGAVCLFTNLPEGSLRDEASAALRDLAEKDPRVLSVL